MMPAAHTMSILRGSVLRGCRLALMMLAVAPGVAKAVSPCANTQPLQLGSNVTTLPDGAIDQPYQYVLRATGGAPPYTYEAGSLPPGIKLSANGTLAGEPSSLPYIAVFVASVRDQHGCTAQHTYRLTITAPWRPPTPAPAPPAPPSPPKPPKPPAPKPPTPLTTLPLADTLAPPTSSQATVTTYMLTDAIFKDKDVQDALKQMSTSAEDATGMTPASEPTDEKAADSASDSNDSNDDVQAANSSIEDDTKAQFQRMLQPLIGLEYPGHDFFAAALDTRVCRFSRELIIAAAKKQNRPPPKMSESDCPPDWKKLDAQGDYTPHDPLPWQQVPQWLMSPDMRELLIDKAAQPHSLLNPPAPLWSGLGCGCVRQLTGTIYAFYPFWHTQDKPMPLDFSVLSRISVFALWFNDDGDLSLPAWNEPTQTDFIREARRHRTALDFTLYHNDWDFLKTATDDSITRITARLADEAADFIDTPLDDLASRSHAWVPGFNKVERYGTGLTLYLDEIPPSTDAKRAVFARYLDQQVQALITELRRRNRPYVLNIVLRDADLIGPDALWQVDAMEQYLQQAESPVSRNHYAAGDSARFRSNTNLTLRYLVMLTQPTDRNMREVQRTIDKDKNLNEEDIRMLLQRVIPIIPSGASSEAMLGEDLGYAADNFGGTGFWAASPSDQSAGKMMSTGVRTAFLAHIPQAEQLNAWICDYRWPLRMIAEALLVLWLIAFSFYRSSCRIREIGLPYQLGLLLGAIAFLVIGALLLVGDPSLAAVRRGNALLALLVMALIATFAYHMLKPRVENP
jgi:hypothetical protein